MHSAVDYTVERQKATSPGPKKLIEVCEDGTIDPI